jgi:uncharacterized membrane protein
VRQFKTNQATGMSKPADTHSAQRTVGLWAATLLGGVGLLAMLAAWFPDSGWHAFFATACHQHPERAHWIAGSPMAVCVRCFWLYVGLAVGHGRFAFGGGVPRWRLAFLVTSLAGAGLHWLLGWTSLFPDVIALRALTGFCVGLAVSNYTLPGLVEWFSKPIRRFSTSSHTYEPHRS